MNIATLVEHNTYSRRSPDCVMRGSHLLLTLFVAVVATIYVCAGLAFDRVTYLHTGLAFAVILLSAIPLIVSLSSKKESLLIPLMSLHGVYYAFTYGFPVLADLLLGALPPNDNDTRVLFTVIIGLVFMNIGFYIFRGLYSKPRAIQFLTGISVKRQIVIAWIMCGLYLLFRIIPTLRSLPSVGHLDDLLGYLSIGLLFTLMLDGYLNRKHVAALAAIVLYSIVNKVFSGSLAPAFFLVVFLGVIYWIKRRTIPWSFVIAGAIAVVAFNPVKHQYRAVAWQDELFASMSFFDKASLFYEATQVFYQSGVLSSLAQDSSTIARVSRVSTLETVMEMTPDEVPYWMGSSYRTLLTSFIPRVIWPGKPESKIGQEFGHRYALLHYDDLTTSYNLPWLPEFYANFGFIGVVFGMFFVGVIFRFIIQKLSAPPGDNLSLILGLAISFSLFYADSNFALLFGGVLLKFLAGLAILFFLTVNYRWKVSGV